jgi:hypothetical protein
MAATVESIKYIYHHVFLPPKLPQEDDQNDGNEAELLRLTIEALQQFQRTLTSSHRNYRHVQTAVDMLRAMSSAHDPDVNESALRTFLRDKNGSGVMIPLFIRAQNAGVLISRMGDSHSGSVRFDLFELSPKNNAVFKSEGRLQRSFPGASIELPIETVHQSGFDSSVAQTLSSLSSTSVSGQQPTARKAGHNHAEDRDTTHPGMITETFANFLAALGTEVPSSELTKNTREEVFWDNARHPWRRSARWLLIRVSLQLVLARLSGSDTLYKQIMLVVMGYMLKSSLARGHVVRADMANAMNAKLARRLLKLAPDARAQVAETVRDIMSTTTQVLQKDWAVVRRQDTFDPALDSARSLHFERDASISLPALDDYIQSIAQRKPNGSKCAFTPDSRLVSFPADCLPTLREAFVDAEVAIANLHNFEEWVALHCGSWRLEHQDNVDTCSSLAKLIKDYHSAAVTYYSGNPEALSVMVLTAVELWTEMDKAAVHLLPLLKEYKPGVNLEALQNLLLPFKNQMVTLHKVEEYMENRRTNTRFTYTKLYVDIESADCFAARYFDSSPKHQQKLQEIETRATQQKTEKLAEFRRLKAEYQQYIRLHREASCEYYDKVVRRGRE